MRLARVRTASGPVPVLWAEGEWHAVDDLFAAEPRLTGARFPAEAPLAAPVEPRVVAGMAHNSGPGDRELPPQAFLKSARTVVGPGEPIVAPPGLGAVHAEGELAVVIGRPARGRASILGCTIANDVTAVGRIAGDSLLTEAKNGGGFTPIGPWIETALEPAGLAIAVTAGGASATGSVDGLARGVEELLAYLTGVLELGPGDVILTGCPATAVPVAPGDTARIRIPGLGELANPVVAARAVPVVVMGVSGSGKSTVGRAAAGRLGRAFVDADDLHPAANKRKMAAGVPLDDEDRAPWLEAVGERLAAGDVVVACSALRRSYRDALRAHAPQAAFVHLDGTREQLTERLAGRDHEYMPASLLDSQLATLEPLEGDERGMAVPIARDVDELAAAIAATMEKGWE